MPICIECRYPLRTLYTTYSKADDQALGKGVRLTQCPRCKRFGDKYVEHDFVVLFIDLVLIKPQVYRHLLFNRLGREDDRFDPSIIRLGVLLLLFDVYLTWARIEKASPTSSPLDSLSNSPNNNNSSSFPNPPQQQQPALLSSQPLVLQYMFFLGLCTAQTLAFHLPIRLLCAHPPRLWLPGFFARWGSSGEDLGVGHGSGSGGLLSPATVAALSSCSGVGTAAAGTTTTTQAIAGSYGIPTSRTTSTPPSGTTTPSYPPATSPRSHSPPPPPPSRKPPPPSYPSSSSNNNNPPPKFIPLIPYHPYPTPISTALLVSSCTKLFPLLLIIWDYDLPSSASAVSWAVIVNNVAALEILMDCGYLRAALLVGVAAAVRAVVGSAVLSTVGFDSYGGACYGEGMEGLAEGVKAVVEAVAGVWGGAGGGGGDGGGGRAWVFSLGREQVGELR